MGITTDFDKVYIYDNNDNEICCGYLWSKKDDNIELRGDSFRLFDHGEKLNVVIEYRNGVKENISAYVNVSQEKYMSLLILFKSTENNQRNYFRVNTSINSKIISEIIEDKAIPFEQPIDICILNFSLGGMLFGSKSDLNVDNRYKANVDLNGTEIEIMFKIIRKFESKKWGNEYGCELLSVSRENERAICKFILDKQREKIVDAHNY